MHVDLAHVIHLGQAPRAKHGGPAGLVRPGNPRHRCNDWLDQDSKISPAAEVVAAAKIAPPEITAAHVVISEIAAIARNFTAR